tara:strand:+ start:383 stop:718 length:336 start_codon:yes stop_codon:yes gene_type:complete
VTIAIVMIVVVIAIVVVLVKVVVMMKVGRVGRRRQEVGAGVGVSSAEILPTTMAKTAKNGRAATTTPRVFPWSRVTKRSLLQAVSPTEGNAEKSQGQRQRKQPWVCGSGTL